MRLTVCLPSTGDLLRDHSEVCTLSVCFYITLWASLHDPFLLLSFFNIQISILFFFFILAWMQQKRAFKKRQQPWIIRLLMLYVPRMPSRTITGINVTFCMFSYITIFFFLSRWQSFTHIVTIQTRTTCENVVKHSMKEMWDIFPGWNVSLWNRYLKGTFTGGKQTQLLKDTVAECINSPSWS